MKKITVMAFLLALLAPMMRAWGDSTYYGRLSVGLTTKSESGSGKVYASTLDTEDSSLYGFQPSADLSGTGQDSVAVGPFYAYAKESPGYEFKGWFASADATGNAASLDRKYKYDNITATSTDKNKPTTKTVYAHFEPRTDLTPFDITFETTIGEGSYTVNGDAPAPKTGLRTPTKITLATSDSNFQSWIINGESVGGSTYTQTFIADTTISAKFLTADQVTTAETYEALVAALANEQYLKITIPSGKEIIVAKGATLTVPTGKQLVVNGKLSVIGALLNNGVISGSGFVLKVTKMISQGEVKVPANAYTTYPDHAYQETTVSANSPAITGNSISSEMLKWGVQLNGGEIYKVNTDPGIIYCSLDTSIAQNHIKAITSASATFSSPGSTGTSMCVLTANTSMDSTTSASLNDKSGYLNFQGKLDTAGYKLTISREARSNFSIWVYNGTYQMTTSTNPQVRLTNCSNFKATSMNAGGDSVLIELYDCGPTFQIGFSKTSSSASPKMVKFYSGTYDSSNSDINYQVFYAVYGGTFKNAPTSSCLDTGLIAKQEASANNYYVVKPNVTEYVAAIGAEQYESLSEAVSRATAGANIKILKNVSLTQSLSIEQGKNVTIDLLGFNISGSSIVNNGTLNIVDSSSAGTMGEVSSAIVNNGTMGTAYGTYSGAITLSGGTFTTHNGLFLGTMTVDGGVADLRGGRFETSVSSLLREGFVETKYAAAEDGDSSYYWVGTNVVAVVTADNPIADAEKSFSAKAITPEEMTYLIDYYSNNKKTRETCGSDAKWFRLAEVLSAVKPFIGYVVDVAAKFDRTVASRSVTLYGGAKASAEPIEITEAVSANSVYRVMSPQIASSGRATAQISYDRVFTTSDPWSILQDVTYGAKNGSTGADNRGTLCKIELQLCTSSKLTITETKHILGSSWFTLGAGSNKAMIRPMTGEATFYATLGAAMDAAADGGTVMLANDCDTALPLNKAGTYTFDTMGFAASDEVSVADGLFVKSSTSVDSSAKVLVPDAKATTYVVAQQVASVGGQFYDNLAEAVKAAGENDVIKLYATATEEITLTAEGQSITLNKNGVEFDDKHIKTDVVNASVVKKVDGDNTVYTVVVGIVEDGNGNKYVSVSDAVDKISGDEISVTVTAEMSEAENVTLPQGKALTVKAAEGVKANVAVTPAEGAFLVESAVEGGTKYESKRITETYSGEEAALSGNGAIVRADNAAAAELKEIAVTLVSTEKTGGAIRKATFEVTPKDANGDAMTGELSGSYVFRLPVDAAATQLAAIVYHGDAQFGVFAVQTYNNEKYVEIESDTFSPYGYELLDGETANPVAIIGTTGYATLAAAVEAVREGETVRLLADVELADSLDVEGMFTLDLGGRVISSAEGATGGRKFTANSAHDYLIGVKYGGTLTIVDSAGGGEIDGGSLLTALKLTTKGETFDGETTADLVIGSEDEAGWNDFTVTGDAYGISGNGTRHGTTLYVYGGTINAQAGTGIYHPQDGVLFIQGGTIAGRDSAVEVRAGDATFWGGSYAVTGDSAYSSTANGSGTTAKGAAIAIAPHTTGRELAVEVLDGNDASGASFSFDVPQGAVRFAVANPQNVDFGAVDVTVAGLGDIFGDSYEVPEQYNWYYDNDMELFGLVKSVAERLAANGAHVAYYLSLDDAISEAQNGETVQLLADITGVTATYNIDKALTIDTNGFEFSGSVKAAEGYAVASSEDGVYVVVDLVSKVDVETVVSEVVSEKWLEANEISTDGKTDEEVQAAVQEVLNEKDDNGNAKWENLVIGQKADEAAAVTAANGGTETTVDVAVTFEVPKDKTTGEKIETGYTVKYAFDKVDETVEGGVVKGAAQDKPTLDFEEVKANEPTYFKMRAVLEASNVTAEVPVEKTIGVVKVASDAEVTIIPVPWQSLGDTDIKATELVHAASLSNDDELIVYGTDGKSQTWIVKNGEWTAPAAEHIIDSGDSEPQKVEAQDPAELKRGQGVILKRKDPSKEIVLIGQPVASEEDVETPIAAATDDEPSWNLVASPKMAEVNISAAFTEEKGNTSDEIIVPTAGTPKHYTYKNGAWGYPGGKVTEEVNHPALGAITVIKTEHKTGDTTINAGTGFWYLNKGTSKSIKW